MYEVVFRTTDPILIVLPSLIGNYIILKLFDADESAEVQLVVYMYRTLFKVVCYNVLWLQLVSHKLPFIAFLPILLDRGNPFKDPFFSLL